MRFKLCGFPHEGTNLLRMIFVFALSLSMTLSMLEGCTTAKGKSDFSEAIRVLAKEQSLAESYVTIVNEFGKEDLNHYAESIRLYANAKSEFDGLIEQLKYNLKEDIALDESSDFQSVLKSAAEKRVAFTTFVTDEIIRDDPERRNPMAIAAIGLAPELIEVLTKAGKTIWQEYRNVKKERKQQILDQLDSLKWKSFNEIGGGG